MDTAGSEQTSSVIMLWAKRVCTYVAGGGYRNEGHLLFYVRSEKT